MALQKSINKEEQSVRSACDGINYSVIGTASFTAFLK
jgi:hypothetical protein